MSTTCRSEAAARSEAFPRREQRFPEDLRNWLKGRALLRLAQSVAQEHTVSALRPVFSLSAARFHHPWRMLAVLTYAYGSGIWHSQSIARIAASDPCLFELCHGEPPSAGIIRRFRAQNRIPILRCLEVLLRRLWCQHHDTRTAALSPLLIAEILYDARYRLHRAEQRDAEGHDGDGSRNK